MDQPLISVIIPAHNNEATLRIAVNSIRRQTYRNLEIIIVDDQSTDGTASAAQAFAREDSRVTYYRLNEDDPNRIDALLGRNVNAGYSARNFGLDKCKGQFVTFQDGDDASRPNRIEMQYGLLVKYDATHVTTGWLPFEERLIGSSTSQIPMFPTLEPDDIYALSQKAKGLVAKISPALNARIPFRYKRLRVLNKLFFGTLDAYPGAGNSPFFRREVIDRVRFRPLSGRVWPSFMGRGADRDFNFQVAETFRKSFFFDVPLYLWRK